MTNHRYLVISILWLVSGCIERQVESTKDPIDDMEMVAQDQGPEDVNDLEIDDSDGCDSDNPNDESCLLDQAVDLCSADDELLDCDHPDCLEDPRCNIESLCASELVITIELDEFVSDQHEGTLSNFEGSCAGGGRESIYHFTATQRGPVCISTFGAETDTVLYVRSSCHDPDTEIACNDDFYGFNAAITLEAEEDEDYTIFVDQFALDQPVDYQLKITLGECTPEEEEPEEEEPEEDCAIPGDENDNGLSDCDDRACLSRPECAQPSDPLACEEGTVITLTDWGTYTGNTEGATDEVHGSCGGQSAGEVIYRFTPSIDGPFCVSTQGSEYDTLLHIRKTCNDPDSELACNDDYIRTQAAVSVEGRAFTTYFMIIDGYRREGAFELTLSEGSCTPPPREDCNEPGDEDNNGDADCDDRACANTEVCATNPPSACDELNIDEISLNRIYEANNEEAPREARGSCAGRGGERVYRFMPTESGTYCATTSGSEYDTVLYIRSECTMPDTELVCNDDFDGNRAAVTFEAEALTPYFVFVDSFRTQAGDYDLQVLEGPCTLDYEVCTRSGDDDLNGLADCEDPACATHPVCLPPQVCESTALLPMNTLGTYQGSTIDQESTDQGSCGGRGAEDVYTFSIAGDSPLCLSTEGSRLDTVLYVRSDCGDPESEIACNDDYFGLASALTINAEANLTYYVFVDSYSRNNDYTIHLNVGECPERSTPERCDQVGDEDQNGLSDCDDPACADLLSCLTPIGALACNPNVMIPIDNWGDYEGETSSAPSGESGSCSGSNREVVYTVSSPDDGPVCVAIIEADFDVTLYARSICEQADSELVCESPTSGAYPQIEIDAEANTTYYVFVDGEESGTYQLSWYAGSCSD